MKPALGNIIALGALSAGFAALCAYALTNSVSLSVYASLAAVTTVIILTIQYNNRKLELALNWLMLAITVGAFGLKATAFLAVIGFGGIGLFFASLLLLLACTLPDAFIYVLAQVVSWRQISKCREVEYYHDRGLPPCTRSDAFTYATTKVSRSRQISETETAAIKSSKIDAWEDSHAHYNNRAGFNQNNDARIAQHIKKETVRLGINKDQELLALFTDSYRKDYDTRWRQYLAE
jgi:hypothetical protein